MRILSLALFGVAGVLSRYYLGVGISKALPGEFPVGTLFVNLSGALIVGLFYVLASEKSLFSDEISIGIMVGFLGGYTTFSSYCLEAVKLVENGRFLWASAYLIGSPVMGYLAAFTGISIGRLFFIK